MSDLLKFSIPGKPEYVQMVRLAIGSVACKANFDMETVEDIKVAVSEACKNVFCHGFEGFSNCYEITCKMDENEMCIDVKGAHGGEDLVKHEKPCTNCPDDGNLALAVIRSLMDHVEIETGEDGNRHIVMVKNR